MSVGKCPLGMCLVGGMPIGDVSSWGNVRQGGVQKSSKIWARGKFNCTSFMIKPVMATQCGS